MASMRRGPEIETNIYVHTVAGDYTVINETVVVVNKASGAATAINLPPGAAYGVSARMLVVKDGKGDAASNNITVTPNGSDTIDGGSTYVISVNYGVVKLSWNGTEWNVVSTNGSGSSGGSTFNTVTANAITGGDSSLDITGKAGAAGAAGGDVIDTAGAGGAGSTTTAGGAGGNAGLVGGTGGAKTDTGHAAGGAGGPAAVTAGAGGNTASNGTDAGGVGGQARVTGGAGGNASAGTGNGGAGGSVKLAPGAGGTSAGGSAGAPGCVFISGAAGSAAFALNVTRSTISNAGTITVAQHRGQVLYQDASGGAVTMTTATGTALDAAFPDLAVGNAIQQFVASNHATNTSTIAGGSGVTLVGSGAVTQTGGTFMLIKTGVGTWDLVRVA